MDIAKLDENFTVCQAEGVNYRLYSPQALGLEGFCWEQENEKPYYRLPDAIMPELNDRLAELRQCSAGGVIRFRTDSKALLLQGRYLPFAMMPHMPLTGQAGFDVMLWENGENRLIMNHCGNLEQIIRQDFDFSLSCPLPGGMHEYRIYMPLYAGVETLEIGLEEGARVEQASPHRVEKPVLFYGSSITQGGCASRPSNCHAALLSAWVDAEQINLGFSGNAKGELSIAEAIGDLPLSCFVMDYDYNAPDAAHLQATHEPFFQTIRAKQPELPVIFITKPLANPDILEEAEKRRDIIMQTYIHAKDRGDRHVYFVDGMRFFDQKARELPTVDRCHPTDLGFYLMAMNIAPVLRLALGL